MADGTEIKRLRQFAKWVIHEACFDGMEIDGGSVQEMAVQLGLVEPFTVTQADLERVSDCDVGDTAYKYSNVLRHVDLPKINS